MSLAAISQPAAARTQLFVVAVSCLALWCASGCDPDGGTAGDRDAEPDPEAAAGGIPKSVSCVPLGKWSVKVELPESSICDGVTDCRDGSDEIDCPDVFLCREVCRTICIIDGSEVKAVPNAKRCDRKADCPFADDEEDCPGSDVLFCDRNDDGLRRVYEPSQVCDGRQDCYWANDEQGCPGFFVCPSDGPGVMSLAREKVCDGEWQCANDEFDCPDLVDPYTCPDGKRIARKFVCDGIEDCPEGAEELDPSCHQFRCTHHSTWLGDRHTRSFDDPWYIDQSRVCNGMRDCYAGNDEESCP
jgi:hypothetical protein